MKSALPESRILNPVLQSSIVNRKSEASVSDSAIYAQSRVINDISDCYFYHTMDVPGYGHVEGEWDLRGKETQYLGGVALKGKRVLEIGTASGFLCFY